MPLQVTRDEFIQMLEDTVAKSVDNRINGEGFTKAVSDTIKEMFESMQKDTNSPFNKDKTDLVKKLPFVSINGGYMQTTKGSYINLNDKRSPWIHASEEMTQWTKDFVKYIKDRSVSKFLSESVDTSGGYAIQVA